MTTLAPPPEHVASPRVVLATPERATASTEPVAQRGRRRDIQGLRAIAVVAVVADHVFERPTGGFLGVDVFFVISGYLITGLLLREFRSSGRIDLLSFYRRRLKRTLPVAWVVAGCTVLAGCFVLTAYGFGQLVPASVSAAGFWSNWHLISVGTDYLHATDAPLAVQHYWSLAVEEQFYLVWPAVLFGALALASRLRLRWMPVVVLICLGGASAIWAAHETFAHPTSAYFSTFTRGWELLFGAGLAFLAPLFGRLPEGVRPWLAWAGLGIIFAGFVVVTPDSSFPYPWALVAVGGTSLVILAGTGTADTQVWPLTNGLAQGVGQISYSIYLWHFPVVIFAGVLHPGPGRAVHAVELLLVALLSVLSYRFIEMPFQRASWRRPRLRLPGRRSVLVSLAVLILAVVLSSGLVISRHGAAPLPPVATSAYFSAQPSGLQRARTADVASALTATSWPKLTPKDQDLGIGALVPEWTRDGCLGSFGAEETARRCVYGDPTASRTVVLYGDSTALSYLPAIRGALAGEDWRIEVLTVGQCPAVEVSVLLGDGAQNPACDDYHRFALARIASERPDLVVMTSSYLSLGHLDLKGQDVLGSDHWRAQALTTVRQLSSDAGHVLLLDAPPLEESPQSCKTGLSSPSWCVSSVSEAWATAAAVQREAVSQLHANNVSYPSTLPWFCSATGYCPSFVDGVVTLADGEHLTGPGSRQLAPLMREALITAVGK